MKLVTHLVVLAALGAFEVSAQAAPLISASGLDGAGLGQLPVARGRIYGDVGYHTEENLSIATVDLGVGCIPKEYLELGLVITLHSGLAS